ncbi:hypothetical protein B296_00007542, partial [Ensete ventricosum]
LQKSQHDQPVQAVRDWRRATSTAAGRAATGGAAGGTRKRPSAPYRYSVGCPGLVSYVESDARKHDVLSLWGMSVICELSKKDPYKNKTRLGFIKDRRRVKREYDEFKARINGLLESIRRRSDAYNGGEEIKTASQQGDKETGKNPKATWMADGTHWPSTWINPSNEHSRGDHARITQVLVTPTCNAVVFVLSPS